MKILSLTYSLVLLLLFSNISIAKNEDQKIVDFTKTVRCLVCDGQSIYDSESEFALNLKSKIFTMYKSGSNINEIEEKLISIYGYEILYSPPKSHFIIWFLPLVIVFFIITIFRKKFS
jgi:cytochrome c-type biogenesis protein CcmH